MVAKLIHQHPPLNHVHILNYEIYSYHENRNHPHDISPLTGSTAYSNTVDSAASCQHPHDTLNLYGVKDNRTVR